MNNKTDGTKGRLGRRPRRAAALAAAAAAMAGTLSLAACSGAPHSSGPAQSTEKQEAAFAQCVRGHGHPNFYPANPNTPTNTSSPRIVLGEQAFTGGGGNQSFSQLMSAVASCRHLDPGLPSAPAGATKQQIDSLVKSAQCMHAHGFSSYPEPDVQNGRVLTHPLPSSIDTSSPQFQAAAKTCSASDG